MATSRTLFISTENSTENALTTNRLHSFHEFVQYFYAKNFPDFLGRIMAKKIGQKRKIAPSVKRIVQTIKKLIDKNLAENLAEGLQLRSIAKKLGLSESYVSRLFKQETGIGIIVYQNQQRIEKAKKLLINTSDTLIRIAQECGFANDSYFNKRFKILTGMTPNQFRENFQGGKDV